MRVSQALAEYTLQLQADGRSPHTVKQASRHVRLFARWAQDPPLVEVDHQMVARFLASDLIRERAGGGARKASSANAIRSSVRGFCAFVHSAGYAPTNAARLVRRARTRVPSPKALSEPDAAKLVTALMAASAPIDTRDRALFVTMLRCGLRLGSTLGLDVEDVNFESGELVLRSLKGGGEAAVVLPDDAAAMLRDHIGARSSGPVFLSSHGTRIGARHVRRRLAQWSTRAAIPSTHPHALRHAFAMRLYTRTQDVVLVAAALTHRNITSSQVYVHADRDAVRRAIG